VSALFSADITDALWQQIVDNGLLGGPIDFHYERATEGELDGPLEFLFQDHMALFEGFQFEILGGDSAGSTVALCRYPGLTGARPAMAFGPDGEIALIASSELALLRQLASGQIWRSRLDRWARPQQPEADASGFDWAPLQAIVRGMLRSVEADPNAAMAAARAEHAPLGAWINRLRVAAAM